MLRNLCFNFIIFTIVLAFSYCDIDKARQNGLDKHNKYRAKHHVGNLTLSTDLNNAAQSHAKFLASNGTLLHATTGYGQNLYQDCSSVSLEDILVKTTDSWYNQISGYDFSNPGFTYGTGSFTQVVWKSSKMIGFGVAIGKVKYGTFTSDCYFIVAFYDPAGNRIDSFAENVLKP